MEVKTSIDMFPISDNAKEFVLYNFSNTFYSPKVTFNMFENSLNNFIKIILKDFSGGIFYTEVFNKFYNIKIMTKESTENLYRIPLNEKIPSKIRSFIDSEYFDLSYHNPNGDSLF